MLKKRVRTSPFFLSERIRCGDKPFINNRDTKIVTHSKMTIRPTNEFLCKKIFVIE